MVCIVLDQKVNLTYKRKEIKKLGCIQSNPTQTDYLPISSGILSAIDLSRRAPYTCTIQEAR